MSEKLSMQRFDEFKLVHDLLRVTGLNGYGHEFRLQLIMPHDFEVFRLYLLFQEKEYPMQVELRAYPFDDATLPHVLFEDLLPLCAIHSGNLHPNITDAGLVDWRAIRIVPGTTTTILELVNLLRELVANPNHSYGVVRSCSRLTQPAVFTDDVLVHTLV